MPLRDAPPMQDPNLDPQIAERIDELRQRIRRYVWVEGVALAIVWLCATFWIGWAIDYLPVRMGSSEMPRGARGVLLAIIGVALLYILYRFVWRRVQAQMQPSSLAVLIERVFPQFHDGLVTAVEFGGMRHDSPIHERLLSSTRQEAADLAKSIDVRRALNYRPLIRACAGASLSLASVLLFGILATGAFSIWVQRLYALSNQPYPRRTSIEVVGFAEKSISIARGTDFRLHVRADATRSTPPPNVCTLFFRTGQGQRGRANLSKQGEVRDGFQYYTYEEKPFRNILSDVEFDIVGGDLRLNGFQIHVVESPQIVGIQLAYELPAYTGLLPRQEPYYNGIQLVRGTHIQLKVTTNKPIQEAVIGDGTAEANALTRLSVAGRSEFEYTIDSLVTGITQEIVLTDMVGIQSTRPYRLTIGVFEDQIPQIEARLLAISNAVTADARIPIAGTATDDFGIESAWVQVKTVDDDRRLDATIASDGAIEIAVDLRELARDGEQPLKPAEGSSLQISVGARDYCDLDGSGQTSHSDPYELQVVSASQLLAMLEARELGLRRRFEQTISEVRETRDSVTHVRSANVTKESAPAALDEADPQADPVRQRALNLLRVQRARQHSERASQEVLGVALSFDDIRNELINNRIDSAERQLRMERDIATPLTHVAEQMFPELSKVLGSLEQNIYQPQVADELTAEAIRQLDEILLAMESVRDKMLDLESYNELIDQMRALIRDQDDLIEKTKKRRKQSALDLLRDN